MLYTVQASVARSSEGGVVTVQVPTFLLSSHIQGIVNLNHAAQIAYDMLKSINPEAGICLSVADENGKTAIKHSDKESNMDANLKEVYRFFSAHAGAEIAAKRIGLVFVWEDDPMGRAEVRSDIRRGLMSREDMPDRIESCTVYKRGKMKRPLASLCGIWDADATYKRVVEAELAGIALEELVTQ